MKEICTVNCEVPSVGNYIEYLSDSSLRDYDIIVFDPAFPYLSRIEFSGGGSCIDIESGASIRKAIFHWRNEIDVALKAGKTVFLLLNSLQEDSIASGYTMPRKGERTYSTIGVRNYEAIPVDLKLRNAKGRRIKVSAPEYAEIYESVKSISEYKVIVNSKLEKRTFLTHDGSEAIGGIVKTGDRSGHIVLIPHVSFSNLVTPNSNNWTKEALRLGKVFAGNLVAIDKMLRTRGKDTPRPGWMDTVPRPRHIDKIDSDINEIREKISELEKEKNIKYSERNSLLNYQDLLFQNGHSLESSVESSLRLLGYDVKNLRMGDLEIDHVIVGANGLRMIGESEGKDNSAVDITKFRQLESNINEDFSRDEVGVPAKGILFGNGYRLIDPSMRENEFTDKCLINAKRLGTALVRTRDLYSVVLHILDHPGDEAFKEKCRNALENTTGGIVAFPDPLKL